MKLNTEKYFPKINVFFIFAALLILIFMGFICDNVYFSRPQTETAEKQYIDMEKNENGYIASFTLPENTVGKSIAFKTSHYESEVFIGDECVYSVKASNPEFSRSTGYRWNFIELEENDAGKTMSILFESTYMNLQPPDYIYFGNEFAIVKDIFFGSSLRFFLATFILILGVILFAYFCIALKKGNNDHSLMYLSIFSILLSLWSTTESPLADLITNHPIANMVINHYSLMIMPAMFVMYIRHIFSSKDSIIWDIYITVNCAVIILRTFLQAAAILDLKQTLILTQANIALFVVIAVILCIHEMLTSKMARETIVNIIGILITMGATVLELALTFLFDQTGLYSIISFIIYIIITSSEMIIKSQKIMARAREAELYRKLAYTDELTGVYNRTAFRNDMDSQIKKDPKTGENFIIPNIVFMFDLNDLKRCNDSFGHENGDKYIKMVSDELVNVFGVDGRCYRIGGDEFCVLMPYSGKSEAEQKMDSFKRGIQKLNRIEFVVPISVAAGYAFFDPDADKNLDDTMKRADELMYRNKQLLKSYAGSAN